jgi:hypothetical protein
MKIRTSIFSSCVFSCAGLFGQDTLHSDTIQQDVNLIIEYGEAPDLREVDLNDTLSRETEPDTTMMLAQDTGICVSIPIEITIYPCVAPDLPVITFVPYTTGPWPWGSWSVAFETTTDYWVTETQPYKNSLCGSLFDTTPLSDSSAFVYCETEPRQVSPTPPVKDPEPTKPAPLPARPWYEAILPARLTVSRFSPLGS